MEILKNIRTGALWTTMLAVMIGTAACERDNTRTFAPTRDEIVWISDVVLPEGEIAVAVGDTFEIGGYGFGPEDRIVLETTAGSSQIYFLDMEATADKALLTVPQGLPDGTYTVIVRRDEARQRLGELTLRIREAIVREELPDIAGMNVKGFVRDALGNPLVGVAVSDGTEIVTTDDQGRYYMHSDKSRGLLFISVPSGYMPATEMNIPKIAYRFQATDLTVEQFDFTLRAVENDRFVFVASTDYHLANRNNDLVQFRDFVNDVNRLVLSEQRPVYIVTMGDLAWDEWWYKGHYYTLANFVTEMKDINAIAFHSIGNHDHDPYYTDDWAATQQWRDLIKMPTYYSYNIGKAHFVCLDNIDYINTGGAVGTVGNKNYANGFSDDQIAWLKKDLALVGDKTAPLFLQLHAPLAYPTTEGYNWLFEESEAKKLLDCLDGFTQVILLTGHSHDNRNCELTEAIMDRNTGGVCACWWWSGSYSGRHICKDGTPGGYGVYEIDGKEVKWYYKGTGVDRRVQFRTYDLNQVHLDPEKWLDGQEISDSDGQPISNRDWFRREPYAQEFLNKRNDNCVWINCWNYDSKWTIRVEEEGVGELKPERIFGYDPLLLIAYMVPRLNRGNRPSFSIPKTAHIWQVRATSPTSTLRITVTDRFGNVYTEEMKRPKTFNICSE